MRPRLHRHVRTRQRRPLPYACTARHKAGPKACNGERVSREKLERAVLRQLASIYRDGSLIRDALAAAQEQAIREQPSLDERSRSIDAEIARAERSVERYFESFEQGRLSPDRCEQRVAGLQERLDDLARSTQSSPRATTMAPGRPRLTTSPRSPASLKR
jgi:hypothetical protein